MQSLLTFCTLADVGVAQLWKHSTVLGSAVEHTAPPVCEQGTKQFVWESSGGKACTGQHKLHLQPSFSLIQRKQSTEGSDAHQQFPKTYSLGTWHTVLPYNSNSLRLFYFCLGFFFWGGGIFFIFIFLSCNLPSLHPPIVFFFFWFLLKIIHLKSLFRP